MSISHLSVVRCVFGARGDQGNRWTPTRLGAFLPGGLAAHAALLAASSLESF
jgi:hypothetical protein